MTRITAELRCLICQNQTIADSNAGLAVDLRRETRELLRQGKSDAEIIAYMTARYGDFVLYRPPLKPTTALLWFGPAAMLVVGAAVLLLVLRRRTRMAAEAFEHDSMAMAPGMTVSSAKQVIVVARISKSGQAAPSAGDLAGEAAPVAPGAANVAVRIDRVIATP